MEKMKYQTAEMEIIMLQVSDVVCSSGDDTWLDEEDTEGF